MQNRVQGGRCGGVPDGVRLAVWESGKEGNLHRHLKRSWGGKPHPKPLGKTGVSLAVRLENWLEVKLAVRVKDGHDAIRPPNVANFDHL